MRLTGIAMVVLPLLSMSCLGSREEAPGASGASLLPVALTCEHRTDPLGVDALPPRLGWKLAPTDERLRGLAQSAYQVLVASDEARLAAGEADLWDSGRVDAARTVDVEYAGQPLGAGQRCVWRVRVWDQDGRASSWSAPARFSIGLLAPADWKAQWIGLDAPAAPVVVASPFAGARWIWSAADPDEAPAAERYFRARFTLDAAPRAANLSLTADNQWRVWLNGTELHASEGTDAWRKPAELDVGAVVFKGDNTLAVAARNEAPGPAGLLAHLSVELDGGGRAELVSDATWSVSDAAPEGWTAPEFDAKEWAPAREICDYGAGPWGTLEAARLHLPPPRMLRREFTPRARPLRATLYASALGLFELELNGKRVGDELFAPGWTDYEKRVPYRTYDVTRLVADGKNALGAWLADGWYAGYVGYGGHRGHYGERPRFLAQLVLEHADGSREIVATDGSWRASTGALVEADFLMGERYDAQREPRGWSEPGFDAKGWSAVDVGLAGALKGAGPVLGAHPGPPVRVVSELTPREIWSTGPDTWVCDLGQNIAGFARLAVQGMAGQELTLRYAERLNPDRSIYVTNLRGARATDVYVCKGGALERWQPRFTFHGFQYVEITGLGHKPAPGELVGLAVTSDTPYVSSLTTSEPELARLMENIRWTQRMNFIDVPTDCPQRDERLGWTGDAQIYARTATWNADVQGFFAKWLVDLADSQSPEGQFPMVAPLKVAGQDGGPAWADAGVICPWTMYAAYGDERMLARAYPSMQRFIEYCEQRSGEDCLPPEKFHCFGDWVAVGGDTPHEVIYTAYFAKCARLMQKTATALGHAADAARYGELFERVKHAFNAAYVDDEGKVRGETQCAYALALSFDLLDGPRRERAAARLVADVEARGGKFSTGFVGTKDLLLALDAIGRTDLVYRLLMSREYPGWRFEISNGATSIWERWDGWTPEKGFQDPGMNSFAHYAFGAVGEWLFGTLIGLGADEPGFAHLQLRPRPGGGLTHAEASYDSIRGRIELAWKRTGDGLTLEVCVPPNVGATLVVPTRAPGSVTEGGKPVAHAHGVRVLGSDESGLRLELVSGRYAFACAEPVMAGG